MNIDEVSKSQQSLENSIEHLQGFAAKALQAWGITRAKLTLIKYRENAVFNVLTTTGEQFALRIHRAGYHSDAALHSELQWIHALAADGIELPEVIPTIDGCLFININTHALTHSETRQVDLFAWVEGQQLGSVENGLGGDPQNIHHIYYTIGQIAARLHNQASQWQLPDNFQRHAWDLEGLVGEQPFWGPFWQLESLSDKQRSLLQTARQSVRKALQNLPKDARSYSMIHADFVPENLLVDGQSIRLIDFDDAGFGWHMFEIATALYFIQDDPYYPVAKTALIEGYRQHRSLPESELALLPLFLTARGLTYLGWVQSRQETETARDLTPDLVQRACKTAADFLSIG